MPYLDVYSPVRGECDIEVEVAEPPSHARGCGHHLQLRLTTGGEIDELFGFSVRIDLTPDECLALEQRLRSSRVLAKLADEELEPTEEHHED